MKQDKIRLKNDLRITRHNNQVYKAQVDNMVMESSISAEKYQRNLTALTYEVERLKSKQSNITRIMDLTIEKRKMMTENENLKSLLKKQAGSVSFER